MRKRGGDGVLRPNCSSTSDKTYTPEELEFLKALDLFKRTVNPRPTWPEVLGVALALGYRKTAEPVDLPLFEKVKNQKERDLTRKRGTL